MLCKFFICFLIYSFMGWIYETLLCTIRDRSWKNRGFLFGPIIPIYGFGASLASFLFLIYPVPWLKNGGHAAIFFTCAIGSFILEYTTSYVLEKIFHAVWWDYSRMPLNIHGRVCLIFTALFGVAGVVIVNWVLPPILALPIFKYEGFVQFLALLLAMMLGMDIALTVTELNEFNRKFVAMNEQINERMAEYVEKFGESVADTREKLSLEHLEAYIKSASLTQKVTVAHVVGFRLKDKDHESIKLQQRMHDFITKNKFRKTIKDEPTEKPCVEDI